VSEKDIVREINALTIMPLPVRIPARWYDLLPRIVPLLRWSAEQPRFYMAEEMIELFLRKWRRVLIRREGQYVWLHLGGVACYEVIPNFIKGVRHRIECGDGEISEAGGKHAVVEHWRRCIDDMEPLGDDEVMSARDEMLMILDPERWYEELGRSWGFAAEGAHLNFGKIRPVVKKWIAKYEGKCNLEEPFGGRLSTGRYPASLGKVDSGPADHAQP
jgi:hypothetical protein